MMHSTNNIVKSFICDGKCTNKVDTEIDHKNITHFEADPYLMLSYLIILAYLKLSDRFV